MLQMVAALVLTERIWPARGLHTHFLKLDMDIPLSVCRTVTGVLLRELGVPLAICVAVAALLRPGAYFITMPFGPHGHATHRRGFKQGVPLCAHRARVGVGAGRPAVCVPGPIALRRHGGLLPFVGFIYVDDRSSQRRGIASASSMKAIRPLRIRFESEGGKAANHAGA